MQNNEEWKQVFIDGIATKYYVSYDGEIVRKTKKGYRKLKPYKNKNGYNRVDIRYITQDNQKKRKTMLLHRIVAKAFIYNDSPEVKDTVHHIDYNKNNNSVANLQYISLRENIQLAKEREKQKRAETVKQLEDDKNTERRM